MNRVEWRHESPLALVSPVAAVRDSLLLHGSANAEDRWTFAGRFQLTEPVVDTERAYLAESRSGLLAVGV